MRFRYTVSLCLIAVIFAACQTKVVPLSQQEELELLAEEKEARAAKDAFDQARDLAAQQLPEFTRLTKANDKLQESARAVFFNRHISASAWLLCDGPSMAGCHDVPVGRLALRPIPGQSEAASKPSSGTQIGAPVKK